MDGLAAVVVDSAYASDLARSLDAHLLVDGHPPPVLHVEVREIRIRHDDTYGTGLQLEQRDVHLVCRRITTVGTTTFYAPINRSAREGADWRDATRVILKMATSPS